MTDLVPPNGRWTAKHKAWIVEAFENGELSQNELRDAGISAAEFIEWRNGYERSGLPGLKTTKLQTVKRYYNFRSGEQWSGTRKRRKQK